MVGSTKGMSENVYPNGLIHNSNGSTEEKVDELRRLLGKADGDTLRIVAVGAGAWGSVFAAMLQDSYGHLRDQVQIRIWRRPGRSVDRGTAEHLFEVINSREDVLRRLIRRCAYLKYVEARLGDRTLYADEILKDGFCLNMIDTPLCPLKVVTNLQEAVWDADIVVNGLPSTEIRGVFEEISRYWKERITVPIIISLAKGIEAELEPEPRIVTPTQMINRATGVPMENILYLGGPNIASEIYNKEYANARICGAEKWRKPLARFLRQPHFVVWDNGDLFTHEVMGGLKNVYAIGAGFFHVNSARARPVEMSLVDYASSDEDEAEIKEEERENFEAPKDESQVPKHDQPPPLPPQTQKSSNEPPGSSYMSEPSVLKLPDASLLLNATHMSSSLVSGYDHSSRVAAAMAECESRKREANELASAVPRGKVPRGALPNSRNVQDTVGGLLVPPQLSGRSNIVTEDIGKLFVRRNADPSTH